MSSHEGHQSLQCHPLPTLTKPPSVLQLGALQTWLHLPENVNLQHTPIIKKMIITPLQILLFIHTSQVLQP
jgi:hypothetical protein